MDLEAVARWKSSQLRYQFEMLVMKCMELSPSPYLSLIFLCILIILASQRELNVLS